MSKTESTRRALLGAIAAAPFAAALPTEAEAAKPEVAAGPDEEDRYKAGYRGGEEITLCWVARAWIDRWKACGGDFSMSFNADGSFRAIMRGMIEPDLWTPTDEGNEKLAPHLWLVEESHQRGAVKVLDAMLEMVPGLRDAVREIAGAAVLASPDGMA